MSKERIANNAFVYPMPMVLVGAKVAGKPNFSAVAWVSRVNYNPPMIAAALGRIHLTNEGIVKEKAFSVNIPNLSLLEKTDYCGLVSGRDVEKAGLFKIVYGEDTGAPMIEECPISMECRLVQAVDLPTNTLFIGQIVGAYADAACLTDGQPDVTKLKPFTLTMPDNRYWKVGAAAGKAWSVGKKLET